MATPFTTATPVVGPITDRQRSYLHSLVVDLFKASDMTAETRDEIIDDKLPTLNRREASELIEEMKLALASAREDAKSTELEDGFYVYESTVYKVIHAANGSGRQYAKALNTVSGAWDYAPGAIKTVALLASPLTLEAAQELGKLYGICVRCGRTLTDETSIAAGIGPICAGRF